MQNFHKQNCQIQEDRVINKEKDQEGSEMFTFQNIIFHSPALGQRLSGGGFEQTPDPG